MAHKLVEEAVEARLRAGFEATCPIFVENVLAELPTDGQPFAVLQFPISDDRRRSLGTKFHEQSGAFRIVLHLPTGIGMEVMRDWGEQISALFRGVKFGGVQTVSPQSPFVNDTPEGGYVWGAIVVPYKFFYSA